MPTKSRKKRASKTARLESAQRKQEAVTCVRENREDLAAVSRRFGISRRTLARWINESSASKEEDLWIPPPPPELSEQDALLARLTNSPKEIVALAREGEPPILAAVEVLRETLNTHSSIEADFFQDVESAIERLLLQYGLRRWRYRSIEVEGRPLNAWTYFSPSEEQLFQAINDKHPLLLAVTLEPQRFTRAIIERYGAGASTRPIFLWTSPSGLFEIENRSETIVFHPIANPTRIAENALFQFFYIPEFRGQSDDTSLRKIALAEKAREDSPVTITRRIGERKVRIWPLVFEDASPISVVAAIDEEEDEAKRSPLSDDETREVREALTEYLVNIVLKTNYLKENATTFKTMEFDKVISRLLDKPTSEAIVILTDGHHHIARDMGPPLAAVNARVLKDAYYRLRRMRRGIKVVLFAADSEFPNDLREELQRIDLPLPTRQELEVALLKHIRGIGLPENLLDSGPGGYLTRLVDASCGMTMGETRTVIERFAKTSADQPSELIAAMHDEKKKSIARSPALELIDLKGVGAELGGLDRLIKWLEARRHVFEKPEAAHDAGIDRRPKGVLLLGIPGTGKSLAAKVVAKSWRLPLLRLDMGAVQDKFVGSSEARIREALKTVEAMSPCVLWIDELDKGVAQGEGTASHSTDLNVRATLLTWMQEHTDPVFVVATANRISHLPPELMRAGRFDARFFLGCPGALGRKDILLLHLKKRRIDEGTLDIEKIVAAMHGFTGAEIEQLVLDALYDSFSEDEQSRPQMRHFEARLVTSKPLIKTIGVRDDKGRGGGLDEVWELIEQGRVELASDDLLTKAQVASLIDPFLYRPVYCRKEQIAGFESLQSKAERLSMSVPHGGAIATVLDAGEDWVFVYTNIRYDQLDKNDFKFLDRISTIENNGIFDTLVVQYGVEQILFLEKSIQEKFKSSSALSQLSDLFAEASS